VSSLRNKNVMLAVGPIRTPFKLLGRQILYLHRADLQEINLPSE
jgi:hypothetical protein